MSNQGPKDQKPVKRSYAKPSAAAEEKARLSLPKASIARHTTLPLPVCDPFPSQLDEGPPTKKLSANEFSSSTETPTVKRAAAATSAREIDPADVKILDGEEPQEFFLLVVAGAMTGQMFRQRQRLTLLGRSQDCEIRVEDDDVSRKHAQFSVLHNQSVMLTDFNSTNGSFVNGVRIKQCLLQDGDRIQLGRSTILKFSRQDEFQKLFERQPLQRPDGPSGAWTMMHSQDFFEHRLEVEFSFSVRHHMPLSIFLVEIDPISEIKTICSKEKVAEINEQMLACVREIFREEDTIGYYRDDAFGVITRGLLPTQAAIYGERLRYRMESTSVTLPNERVLQTSVSVGIATMYTQKFDSMGELLQQADERLFYGKRNGGNQVIAEAFNVHW